MTAQYFPYPGLSEKVVNSEKKLKRSIRSIDEWGRLNIYQAFTDVADGCVPFTFRMHKEFVTVSQQGKDVIFPRPLPINNHTNIICGYEKWLKHKYCLPGFVEVEQGDFVVDCGAYVGGFSLSAARIAGEVHMFEPDLINVKCARRNLNSFGNVKINCEGLYYITTRLPLHVSSSSVEHSFIEPDDGELLGTRTVPVRCLSDYLSEIGVSDVDFLKVEAEGCEHEVLRGLCEQRPKKLAIDVSPEKNGESPYLEIKKTLESWGYKTQKRMNVLFARFK
ncbi:FkbM family methyltransferase [Microbulbifer mangrovi]|uniref:FkbM family methyltransferase n=1 Tax=Microbulbifer mangrovi TaxID=927787 RepID=UPI0009909010|nr:FkbM family methyltransferase [Microbulbifer mangrovi]